jgi:2-polyprenyl-6-methoxyphenol hydroxylase-like FAD-dependent oxidoreductase
MSTILFIGGGVAGPVAALRFAQDGHKCIVFERSSGPQTIGGAINLAPNGMRLMDRLGVVEEVKKRGCTIPEFQIREEKGSILGSHANTSKDGFTGVRIMRSDMQAVLLEEIKRQGIGVQYRKNLTSITEANGKVTATFQDDTTVEGDFLIGADGIHSKVREYVLDADTIKPEYTGQSLVYGILPTSDIPEVDISSMPLTMAIFSRRGFFATAFTNESRSKLYWFSAQAKDKVEDSVDADVIRSEAEQRFKDVFDPIPRCIKATNDFFSWPTFRIARLDTWHKGRVVLVGDAAHALPPNGGQGVSQAMEDVFCLAKVIKAGKELERYEEVRFPRIDGLRGKMNDHQREKERTAWQQWVLGWSMWSALWVIYLKGWILGGVDLFNYDIDEVDI